MRPLSNVAAVLLLVVLPATAASIAATPTAMAAMSHHLRRGDTLPAAVLQAGPVIDYAARHLRRPPDGYGWFSVAGDMVMASLSSGLIVEVVEN